MLYIICILCGIALGIGAMYVEAELLFDLVYKRYIKKENKNDNEVKGIK